MKFTRRHRIRILSATFLAAIALTTTSIITAQPAEKPFFPLMAWDDAKDTDTLQKMADCGVNAVAFVPPELLDACQERGIKAIVFDPRVTPAWDKPFNATSASIVLKEIIAKYNSHPAVYGYHLKDEPGGDQLAELGKAMELVQQLAPGKWPYINLPPGMGDWYANEFLQLYVDTCKPPIISYDNYALGEKVEFSYGFWANIHDIRSAAVRNKLPFHNIIQTAAHWNYRVPSAADLRLQIYGSLAYGCQGFGFYKFLSEPLAVLEAPDLGNFRQAPLDEFGEKTDTWESLRNVNRQVHNLAPTLLKLRTDDVYHVGNIPERNHGVTSSTLISGLEAGLDFVIGDFTHEDGSRYSLIVNKSLQESTFCRPKYTTTPKAVKYVCPRDGQLKPYPNPWYALAPGQGVLLKLE